MVKNQPRDHHYVPQGYLRLFAENKNVLYVSNKQFDSIRLTSPKGIGYLKDFYTVDTVDETDSAEVERNLSKIETGCIPLLGKLLYAEDLPNAEWADVAIYIALQYGRTPHMRNKMDTAATALLNNYLKDTLTDALDDPRKYAELEREIAEKDPKLLVVHTRENIEKLVSGPKILEEFNLDNGTYVQSIFRMAGEIVDGLLKRHWTVLHAPKGSSFITSDNPLTLSIDRTLLPYESLAILLPGAMRYFPLSAKACLLITDENVGRIISHKAITKDEVRRINKLLYRESLKYAVSGNRRLLSSLM